MKTGKLIIIYEGKGACQKCEGWKRVANSDDQESWKYWAELPSQAALAVHMGLIKPVECPRCQGTGREPVQETHVTKVRLCCCIPDQENLSERCQKPAEYQIWQGYEPGLEDYTESCAEHLEEMLDASPRFEVLRIPEAA